MKPNPFRLILLAGVLLALILMAVTVTAQDITPAVTVSDQVILDGHVLVERAVSSGTGFVVVHIDDGTGGFGAVIGHASVVDGINENVIIPIDASMTTPSMFVMLHSDDSMVGLYEFGAVEGADAPVTVGEQVIAPRFSAEVLNAHAQFITDNTVVIESVVTQQDGFVVIHADAGDAPGPVLGQTSVTAGININVAVEIVPEGRTDILWPMLHVDDTRIGIYEFGTVEGADVPVVVNGVVATVPINTVPSIDARDQVATLTVLIDSVLTDGPGFVVIHADAGDAPGAVLGQGALVDGFNGNVVVVVDAENLTDVVWPMLHVDDNTIGTYEFGDVQGADAPVVVDDNVVTFPISTTGETLVVVEDVVEDVATAAPTVDATAQAAATVPASTACTVTSAGGNVNMRAGAGTGFDVQNRLLEGDSAAVTGQVVADDGFVWWQLGTDGWVRADVVMADGNCDSVPTVESPALPPAPAATEEAST